MDMESFERLSDGDLAQLLAGDHAEAAYTELYRRYAGRIFDFVARTVHDPVAAEEITQRALIRAWEQPDSLRAPGAVRAWLFRIANNLRLNHVSVTPPTMEGDDQAAVLETADASPEERELSRDAARLVWDAAASLEPQQQATLELAVRQQLSSAEIAGVLLVEPAQASEIVNRSREALGIAVRNLLIARRRSQCDRLAALVPPGQLTPATHASVDDHMRRCERCHEIAARVTAPEEILGALVPLPLPDSLRTPPQLSERPTAAGLGVQEAAGLPRVKPPAPSRIVPPDQRMRRRRAAVLIALVVLVAGGGGSLTYLLLHGRTSGGVAASAVNSGNGQSASSSQGATATPLFGEPLPADVPPLSPSATSAPTPTLAPAGQPPPGTAPPTPPPLAVTAISICFFDAHNVCHAGTAARGCTPSGSGSGDVCRFEVSFRLSPGVATTVHWSLQGTVAYCVGRAGAQSAPFGPVSGSLAVPGTSSPETVTTPAQSLSIDVNPSKGTVSTAIVTSPEGPGVSGTTGFYGTGNC